MIIKPMLAKVYIEGKTKLKLPVMVQPKLDGVRAIRPQDYPLHSRAGKPLHIPDEMQHQINLIENADLDGELFSHELTFEQVSGYVRSLTKQPQGTPKFKYWVFDCVAQGTFKSRYETLQRVLTPYYEKIPYNDRLIQLVETYTIRSPELFEEFFQGFLAQGFEGMMIRDPESTYQQKRTSSLLKLKPWLECKAIIVDFVEGMGKYQGSLGALVVQSVDKDWQCNVGTGFDDARRELVWSNQSYFISKNIVLKYQELTAKGNPRFPVFVSMEENENGLKP